MLRDLLLAVNYLVLAYFVIYACVTLSILALSWRALVRSGAGDSEEIRRSILQSPLAPSVTVIIPAFNEEVGIIDSTRSALSLEYPNLEVVVANDGSTDATLKLLLEHFEARPIRRAPRDDDIPTAPTRGLWRSELSHHRLLVVDKENGGRPDAINAGLNVASGELVCLVDGDSMLESQALLRIVRLFIERPRKVVAAGGIVRIANGCEIVDGTLVQVGLPRSHLARFQVVEYLRAFLASRAGFARLNAMLIISGAFGVFRTELVRRVGGLDTTTLCEDFELVMRLHRHLAGTDYEIAFLPDPVCWTEAPTSLRVLRRQRIRWHHGLGQVLSRYRRVIGNPRYGPVGLLSVPFFLLFELLGPAVEVVGFVVVPVSWALDLVNLAFFGMFVLLAVVFGTVLSLLAVVLEEAALHRYPGARDILLLGLYGAAENLGYRQLLAAWRFWALVRLALGREAKWGSMPRSGLGTTQNGST